MAIIVIRSAANLMWMVKRINIELTCCAHRGFGEVGRDWEWSGVTIYRFVARPPNPIVGTVVATSW